MVTPAPTEMRGILWKATQTYVLQRQARKKLDLTWALTRSPSTWRVCQFRHSGADGAFPLLAYRSGSANQDDQSSCRHPSKLSSTPPPEVFPSAAPQVIGKLRRLIHPQRPNLIAETQSMSEQTPSPIPTTHVRCCITGGGPAGMMLAFLLARGGVEVLVLEKHADFLRDFRGDTIHPSTLQVMHELGILEDFLQRPHQEARQVSGYISGKEVIVADFSHLPTRCPFIAFMPQWDFLNFLAERGKRYPTFHVMMQAEVTGLLTEGDRIAGVTVTTPEGPREVRAHLVVGADGRHSTVRERAGLRVDNRGAPMDVLWMRLSRQAGDPKQPLGRFDRGKIFIMPDRGGYWQCGYVMAKGGIGEIRQGGLQAFRDHIAEIAPFMSNRVGELRDWGDVKLLTVAVDRLRTWYRPGLLCIGDAAHAMSPVGGVGINLAIQDAIAAANILAEPLRNTAVAQSQLRKVQRRREFPTRVTQRLQIIIQDRVIRRILGSQKQLALPWPLRLLRRWPILRRIPARLIGMGVRPEHVRTPDVWGTRRDSSA